MKRKIIFVCFGRLTDKMARDWYIDYLIEKGMIVEYWDIVSLVREEHSERGAQNPGYLFVFRTFGEVETTLRKPENRDALYLMLITYTGRFTRVFRLFSKYDCRMLNFAWGALPRDPVTSGESRSVAFEPLPMCQRNCQQNKGDRIQKTEACKTIRNRLRCRRGTSERQ